MNSDPSIAILEILFYFSRDNPGQFLSEMLDRSRSLRTATLGSLIRTSLDEGDTVSVINWILNPPSSHFMW